MHAFGVQFSHVRVFGVQFSHVSVFSDSRNVQKRATKSDTLGHCLAGETLAWDLIFAGAGEPAHGTRAGSGGLSGCCFVWSGVAQGA